MVRFCRELGFSRVTFEDFSVEERAMQCRFRKCKVVDECMGRKTDVLCARRRLNKAGSDGGRFHAFGLGLCLQEESMLCLEMRQFRRWCCCMCWGLRV